MKKVLLLILSLCAVSVHAGDCDITLSAVALNQGDKVPESIKEKVKTRLMQAANASGVTAIDGYDRFFIGARFDNALYDVIPGPPIKTAVKSNLTVYIGDNFDKKVVASTSFDVNGVGTTEERAYINAMSSLNKRNRAFASFISDGVDKIIEYYDRNYTSILNKAKEAMTMRDYREALYYSTSIPACCKGYSEASELTLAIYRQHIDYEGSVLIGKAKAAWGTDPDSYGAETALGYIAEIDPESKYYKEGEALAKEISSKVKADWEYENHKKYEDLLELEKENIKTERQRIAAAKEVGVAWGQNQKAPQYNYNWVK
ncbi:MAG: hypothetical protein IJY31_04720 [Muribaculaceae bacterium]|nr:hypothetical protein [Muribaculaceae bacterium]